MRISAEMDNITHEILQSASAVGAQVRRMHEYEASLEDLFIVIMERLGYEVKSSEQLLASPVQARQADVPKDYSGVIS